MQDKDIEPGTIVMYHKTDKTFQPVIVKIIHRDDINPYYTIVMDCKEKQTERKRLFTVEDINTMVVMMTEISNALNNE